MKKILCILLLMCIIFLTIASCSGKNPKQDDDTEESMKKEEATTVNYEVYDDLGNDINLGGKEIVIASVKRSLYLDEIEVERYSGELVNDAIYSRNRAVEQRLNIDIKNNQIPSNQYAVLTSVRNAMAAGTHDYGLISSPVYVACMYADDGCLLDIRKMSALNLSKPYWSQLFNETASVGNSQYIATGAVSLSFYRFLYVTIVNDVILNSHPNAPDLYDIVDDKEWTLDYQFALAKEYYIDKGVEGKDSSDQFGFVSTPYNGMDPYWSSCEIKILEKDAYNNYKYVLDSASQKERLSNVVDIMINMFEHESVWPEPHDYKDETGAGEWNKINEKFASGTALMATIRLGGVEGNAIRNMTDSYSILPIPKYSKDQEKYYSFIQDSFTGMAIAATAEPWEIDNLAIVMEAMASESYRTVTPAYYERSLKGKYMNDPESVRMLDMITQNVYMDGGVLLTKDLRSVSQGIRNIVRDAVNNGTGNTTASTYSSQEDEKIKEALQIFLDKIKDIQRNQAEIY